MRHLLGSTFEPGPPAIIPTGRVGHYRPADINRRKINGLSVTICGKPLFSGDLSDGITSCFHQFGRGSQSEDQEQHNKPRAILESYLPYARNCAVGRPSVVIARADTCPVHVVDELGDRDHSIARR